MVLGPVKLDRDEWSYLSSFWIRSWANLVRKAEGPADWVSRVSGRNVVIGANIYGR